MENSRKTYGLADLKIQVIQDETAQKTFVIFSTLMETQFYSPGVRVVASGEEVSLEFVRAGIQDKDVQIDLKAPYLVKWIEGRNVSAEQRIRLKENFTSADQLLELDGGVAVIYVKDGDDKNLVWKK